MNREMRWCQIAGNAFIENSSKRLPFFGLCERGCEEMNPHFFTAPFYFAFIWFKVQGSGGGFAAF